VGIWPMRTVSHQAMLQLHSAVEACMFDLCHGRMLLIVWGAVSEAIKNQCPSPDAIDFSFLRYRRNHPIMRAF
jgi:hypothetical protein